MAEGRPVLDQVNLVVRDMEASAAFYRRLGHIDDGPPTWAPHHRLASMAGGADMELDSTTSVRSWNEGWPHAEGGAVVLGFRVASRDEVDRVYAEMTGAGYHGQQAPFDAFWGARYAILQDPDGHAVGLMSPVDRKRATAPPAPGERATA